MQQLLTLSSITGYEFRMQIHRRSLWIAFLLFTLLLSGLLRGGKVILFTYLLTNPDHLSLLRLLVTWTNATNTFLPLVIGVMLADRLARDKRTKVDELFLTMQSPLSIRLIGKYLGATFATIVPMFLYYCVGVGCILYQSHNLLTIPLALLTFAGIVLPGILFIGAFSVACPALLWVPLYQFLFVGYWFWGNVLSPKFGIPTLNQTLLTPIGTYISAGLFGGDRYQALFGPFATPLQGLESMSLLVGIAMFVMFALWAYLRWEQARQ
jgi:ABC-2 type transport system permease protein